MDEAVDPVVPLTVHEVALTTINVPTDDGALCLYPVIGVWADLLPVRDSGAVVETGSDRVLPVLVVTDSVLDATDPSQMTVLISQVPVEAAAADDLDPDAEVSSFGPHWSLRLPTSWVGMALVVTGTPLQMRVLLVDGAPPLEPQTHVLTLEEVTAVVIPTVSGVAATLSPVMGPEWSAPVPISIAHVHQPSGPNLMRDQLWSLVAGMALGQERAWNRLLSFVEVAARMEHAADTSEQVRLAAITEAADWLSESCQLVPLPRTEDGQVRWPAPLVPLVEKFVECLDVDAFDALDRGVPFAVAAPEHGIATALVALSVLVAAKADGATDPTLTIDADFTRFTPAYLLGVWLDEDTDAPWWASRATHHLLLHHDTEVLVNLLSCAPEESQYGHGPMAVRLLHVLTEALAALDLDAETFAQKVTALDVVPPGVSDILHVCRRLLTTCAEVVNADADECPGCVAVEELVEGIEDQQRLLRAAVGTLPVLADLTADLDGLVVGEPDWLTHRENFLMHWLNHTAFHPLDA